MDSENNLTLYARTHAHAVRTHIPVLSGVFNIFMYFDLVITFLSLHPQEIYLNTK